MGNDFEIASFFIFFESYAFNVQFYRSEVCIYKKVMLIDIEK